MAAVSARFWGWRDGLGLLPASQRWTFFGPGMLAVECGAGAGPTRSPGWPRRAGRFAERAGRLAPDVRDVVTDLRHRPWDLATALAATPTTFLHGDWKMGNLGAHPDGRTILLDCAYPGEGPACHELAWYLSVNRARLPEPKEAAIARFRAALESQGVGDRRLVGPSARPVPAGQRWSSSAGRRPSATRTSWRWWLDRARDGARWA